MDNLVLIYSQMHSILFFPMIMVPKVKELDVFVFDSTLIAKHTRK